jgi:pyruvate formate lyase activating enzyme
MVEELGPDVPWHFSAFHPDYRMRQKPATAPATLRRARRIAMEHGMRFVYTGNVRDAEGDTTWCAGCGAPLIVRDWYELREWRLDAKGCCSACGALCPGIFEPEAGSWGARRQPVRLADFS